MVVSLGLYSLAGETQGIPVDVVIHDKCHLLYCHGAKYFTCLLLTVGCKLWAGGKEQIPVCCNGTALFWNLAIREEPGQHSCYLNMTWAHVGPVPSLCGQQRWGHRASSES